MKHWKAESEAIKTVLDNGNASAQKMTTHGEVDKILAKQAVDFLLSFVRRTSSMLPT